MALMRVTVAPGRQVVVVAHAQVAVVVGCMLHGAVLPAVVAFVAPALAPAAFAASHLLVANANPDWSVPSFPLLCLVLLATLQTGLLHLPFLHPHFQPPQCLLRGVLHQLRCWPSAFAV